jgi:hypothetical protein
MSGPVVLLDVPRAGGERLLLTVQPFNGRPVISLRNWFTAGDGELRPSRAGVTIPQAFAADLADALLEAARLAVEAR